MSERFHEKTMTMFRKRTLLTIANHDSSFGQVNKNTHSEHKKNMEHNKRTNVVPASVLSWKKSSICTVARALTSINSEKKLIVTV